MASLTSTKRIAGVIFGPKETRGIVFVFGGFLAIYLGSRLQLAAVAPQDIDPLVGSLAQFLVLFAGALGCQVPVGSRINGLRNLRRRGWVSPGASELLIVCSGTLRLAAFCILFAAAVAVQRSVLSGDLVTQISPSVLSVVSVGFVSALMGFLVGRAVSSRNLIAQASVAYAMSVMVGLALFVTAIFASVQSPYGALSLKPISRSLPEWQEVSREYIVAQGMLFGVMALALALMACAIDVGFRARLSQAYVLIPMLLALGASATWIGSVEAPVIVRAGEQRCIGTAPVVCAWPAFGLEQRRMEAAARAFYSVAPEHMHPRKIVQGDPSHNATRNDGVIQIPYLPVSDMQARVFAAESVFIYLGCAPAEIQRSADLARVFEAFVGGGFSEPSGRVKAQRALRQLSFCSR